MSCKNPTSCLTCGWFRSRIPDFPAWRERVPGRSMMALAHGAEATELESPLFLGVLRGGDGARPAELLIPGGRVRGFTLSAIGISVRFDYPVRPGDVYHAEILDEIEHNDGGDKGFIWTYRANGEQMGAIFVLNTEAVLERL